MLSVILAIALLVGVIWWGQRSQRRSPRFRYGVPRSSPIKPIKGKIPGKLRRELIRIAGNTAVAERLVNNLRAKYPGKPENWYWEKAIFDLERDRRY